MTEGGYQPTMWREPCAHRVGRRSIVVLALVCGVIAALAVSGTAAAAPSACAEAVLDDWTRGALDPSYSPECYEEAIDALPEDLRAYTTAADDITRAAIAASRATTSASGNGGSARRLTSESVGADLRAFPTEVAVLAAVLVLIGAGGVAAAILRRRRGA